MEHEPPALPEQPAREPAAAPPPPGERAQALQTLQRVILTIAPARSAIADFCVLWQTGALLSTSKEMLGARGDFLNTRTTLKGKRGGHQISRVGLRAYAEGCPQLSSVDLRNCLQNAEACVIALSKGCPKLSSLDLGDCCEITDACVIALSQGCPQLSYLYLYDCNQITDACVTALSQGYPQLMISN